MFSVTLPDVLVSGSMKHIAFRSEHGYVLARGRANAMLPELWANGLGYPELPKAETPQWRCDDAGCAARLESAVVAFPTNPAAAAQDCHHASVIITASPVMPCVHGVRVVNPKTLAASSVTALWVADDGALRVETSADWQGKRPWNILPAGADEADED